MQDYAANFLNAWMLICKLRHSPTAPERKTGKGILYCQYTAAHPVPVNIQEMMDAIVEACPFHVFVGLGTNPAKPMQFRCEVWRAEEPAIAHEISRQYNGVSEVLGQGPVPTRLFQAGQACVASFEATGANLTAKIADELVLSVVDTGSTLPAGNVSASRGVKLAAGA